MSFPGIHIWTDIRHLDHKNKRITEFKCSIRVRSHRFFVILESSSLPCSRKRDIFRISNSESNNSNRNVQIWYFDIFENYQFRPRNGMFSQNYSNIGDFGFEITFHTRKMLF